MTSPDLQKGVIEDAALLHKQGAQVVLVHGGGPEINTLLRALSLESRFIDGLRYTDKETLEAVQMALCGKVNKNLTALLFQCGVEAAGLSGLDAGLLTARQLSEKWGYVGDVETVNTAFLCKLLDLRVLPVISTVALNAAPAAEDLRKGILALNVNADNAAAAIAAALKASVFVMMTDTPGVLRDRNRPETRIDSLTLDEIPALKADGVISGGMIPKIDGAAKALRGGAARVLIIDGRTAGALRSVFDAARPPCGTVIN
jgi:acetylglutamate kinase